MPANSLKRHCLLAVLACTALLSSAQDDDLPKDYLPASFHVGRREALREKMPANSVVVVFAYPTRNFSNDVDYLYHASRDMYYFTGYKEPHSLLLVFKESQTDSAGNAFNEILFVQKRNPQAEQWTGKRLGTDGASRCSGIKTVYNGEDFARVAINFSGFDKIILNRFPDDLSDNPRDHAELFDLISQFKQKAAVPEDPGKDARFDMRSYYQLTAGLRELKTPEEKDLLRKAIEISCLGQNEVMKSVRPDMSELEIQGLHEYVHKKYGAEGVGYGSIVGAGENGCILHYEENTKTRVGSSLLLMDVGAEYHGYTADVTRTVPAGGKFSAEEKIIYQLVYDAQEAAFKTLHDGSKWADAEVAARTVIENGLLKLGIIKDKSEVRKYFPHGLGHHIGLDVHDRGTYGNMKKDMVMTVEPGIYIPTGSNCDKKWWSIAVRIEDDALITENGYELLSKFAPRSIADIEKMIAEKSAIDNFKLPPLQSAQKKGF